MIKIKDPADCCGCSACASICAHDAITMIPDSLGYLYPSVDLDKCVNCGLCEKVCSFNEHYLTDRTIPTPLAFAARHKNKQEIATSRSGAVFIALSDWVLDQGGVVYGAAFSESFRVIHKRARSKGERNEFKGSKYVQSDLSLIFRQVKQDLKNNTPVLFSGTPCQTSALNAYVGTKYKENLFLLDIICHGVASPYLWRDYLAYLEEKEGDKLEKVNFRDKQQFGWSAHHETFKFVKSEKKSFDFLFYDNAMYRYSCGKCHFCNTRRPSDVTIGDFWGWERSVPEMNKDDMGISLVLLNTKKGIDLFNSIRSELIFAPVKLEDCLQPNLQYPTTLPSNREEFEKIYRQKGFEYVMRYYGYLGWKLLAKRWKNRITNKLKRLFYR